MNIPGFTAETSLSLTNGRYRAVAGASNAWVDARGVFPQLPIGFCQANCDAISDPFLSAVCRLQCVDQGGGGGDGGGGQSCLPRPLGCQDDPNSPTGCSIFFRQPDCKVVPLTECQCPVTCGRCIGVKQCSDGTQKPCSC